MKLSDRQRIPQLFRLVHDYEDTDWDIVNDVIFRGLPAYLEQLVALLPKLPEN